MKYAINIQKSAQSRLADVDFENLPFGRTFSDHMFVSDYENGEWKNHRIEPFATFSSDSYMCTSVGPESDTDSAESKERCIRVPSSGDKS